MNITEAQGIDLADLSDEDLLKFLDECEATAEACDVMSESMKLLANSGYGVQLEKNFRYFRPIIGESITQTGQAYVKMIESAINKYASKFFGKEIDVISRVDTDSTFFETYLHTSEGKFKIGELYEQNLGAEIILDNDRYIAIPKKDIFTLGVLNESKELCSRKINYMMKHKVKKRMFKIRVGEEEIKCTCDHSLMILRDEKIIAVKPTEVLKTDKFIKLILNTK